MTPVVDHQQDHLVGEAELALEVVRRRIRGHGGDVRVVGIQDGVVKVSFEGACIGCVAQATTFVGAVQRALLEVPGVSGVICDQLQFSDYVTRRIASALDVL